MSDLEDSDRDFLAAARTVHTLASHPWLERLRSDPTVFNGTNYAGKEPLEWRADGQRMLREMFHDQGLQPGWVHSRAEARMYMVAAYSSAIAIAVAASLIDGDYASYCRQLAIARSWLEYADDLRAMCFADEIDVYRHLSDRQDD